MLKISTRKWILTPVVCKFFIISRTWRVSSQGRFPGPIARRSVWADWLRTQTETSMFKQVPWNANLHSDAFDDHSFIFTLPKSEETDFEKQISKFRWKKKWVHLFHLAFQLCQTPSIPTPSNWAMRAFHHPARGSSPQWWNHHLGVKQVLIISESQGGAEAGKPVGTD